jgi:hypothetical protein
VLLTEAVLGQAQAQVLAVLVQVLDLLVVLELAPEEVDLEPVDLEPEARVLVVLVELIPQVVEEHQDNVKLRNKKGLYIRVLFYKRSF